MSLLHTLIPLLFTISLAGLVAAVGLDADADDLLYLVRRPVQLAKAVLAVNVIVPIAAALLVFVFPLSPVARAGILLMAVSPVPPLVPGSELKVGAAKSYAYGLYAALIVLAVVTVPLAVAIFARVYGVNVVLPVPMVARDVLLSVLLPLAVGLAVRRLAPGAARRILPTVKALTMILLLLAAAPVIVIAAPAMTRLIGNGTVLAMALTAAIALAAGHLLGGPDVQDRAALAVTAATRHPGLALMIATANHADRAIAAAILDFLIVGALVAIPYRRWLKRRHAAVGAPAHT
jgi:BASS family bile acid:Na+ symporter